MMLCKRRYRDVESPEAPDNADGERAAGTVGTADVCTVFGDDEAIVLCDEGGLEAGLEPTGPVRAGDVWV